MFFFYFATGMGMRVGPDVTSPFCPLGRVHGPGRSPVSCPLFLIGSDTFVMRFFTFLYAYTVLLLPLSCTYTF